jgi:hypothetical protein
MPCRRQHHCKLRRVSNLEWVSVDVATHSLSGRLLQGQRQHLSGIPAWPSGQGKTCRNMGLSCHGSNQARHYHPWLFRPRICQRSSNRLVYPGWALPDPDPLSREAHCSKNPGNYSSPQLEPRSVQRPAHWLEPVDRNSRIPLLEYPCLFAFQCEFCQLGLRWCWCWCWCWKLIGFRNSVSLLRLVSRYLPVQRLPKHTLASDRARH